MEVKVSFKNLYILDLFFSILQIEIPQKYVFLKNESSWLATPAWHTCSFKCSEQNNKDKIFTLFLKYVG